MSMELLIEKIKKTGNPTVAGLDPKLDYVPEYMKQEAFETYGKNARGAGEALFQFNKGLIDELYDVVPAVKPQMAYYEMYGLAGLEALAKTVSYAKEKGLYVILDGKRNDIGSTAEAYAAAYLGESKIDDDAAWTDFPADCLTVNPYLGTDGVMPFVKLCEEKDKGIFVLVKTSNPSSGEFQDLKIDESTLYEKVAGLVNEWGESTIGASGYSGVGAVVGATYPQQISDLRKIMPKTYFLVPGYGAQGGKAEDVAKAFNSDGLGAIINASRSIMCAYKKSGAPEKDYAKAAKAEALRMKEDIVRFL
ncbi:MAG: orotidine-5'-phosphate decarboxylase [Clostridia bacterium]|nr:orotidine-5'-phosphate decarboxylase [Clostridia bacterium]